MRLHRFYIREKIGSKATLTISYPELVNQLKRVFRLTHGNDVVLFDNSGFDFFAKIHEYGHGNITFSILKSQENTILPSREIYLFASIIKKDNFEWIAEKTTELGVSHIIPIISERSEKKNLNIERLEKIIIEASEQSGRGTIPILHEIMDLKSSLINFTHIKSIAWDIDSAKFVSQDIVDSTGAYIGPEGGWSPQERELFKQHAVKIRSLGPQILRAETAVVAVLSHLVF